MPRALWSGSLSFGLVNVPVQLFSAVRDLDLHFHQLHEKDGSPIETRRFCSAEEREVPYEEIVHGYDLEEEDRQVVVTDEELAAVAPRKTRTIDIHAFVDLAEVDPIHFDHPYFLAPSGDSEGTRRAYQLLLEVMRSTERAALGRFVLRSKEYLVAIRVRDDRLTLSTMLFADEIRDAADLPTGGRKPSKKQLEGAVKLIDALSEPWDPGAYEDRYRRRLQDVVERKKRGKRIRAPKQEPQPSPVPDLMAALERSLREAHGRRGGRSGGGDGDGDGKGDDKGGDDLGSLSRDELYERAQQADVSGRSSMTKEELIDALSR
jgi:DNA end-binding protein Ku